MNNTAIDYTARIAAAHRADVAADIAAARIARRTRSATQPTASEPATEPPATEAPSRRRGWTRWVAALRPAL